MPNANRPGAADGQRAATDCAITPGARVNAGTIAVPSRSDGAHCDARTSGVNASAPSDSADHTSV